MPVVEIDTHKGTLAACALNDVGQAVRSDLPEPPGRLCGPTGLAA
jgi:hypothetical protein